MSYKRSLQATLIRPIWFQTRMVHRVLLGSARGRRRSRLTRQQPIMTSQEKSDFSFIVYVLFSLKDKKLYIGYTTNLDLRLKEHNSGRVTSTKNRRPFKLIYHEVFINKEDAKAREVFMKSGFGRNELKKALKRTLTKLDYKNL